MTTPKPQITLHRGWDEPNRYVWPPFVTKLEFRFRASSIPYTCAIGSTTSGPKGKVSYNTLSEPSNPDLEPTSHADSTLILKHSIESSNPPSLNDHLSTKEKATDLAIRALLEEKLCFYHTYERWICNYYAMRDYALWQIP